MNYYTFYLLNGQRKVFMGINEQDAYLNNQSYADGQIAISHVDEGITDNYYWKNRTWNKKEVLYLTEKPAIILPHAFTIVSGMYYTFENKDELHIGLKWGHFVFGWAQYVEICYAHYQNGSYDGTDTDDHHYIVSGVQYIDPSNIKDAMQVFMDRISSDKPQIPIATDSNLSLQDIKDHQSPDSIYTNLNNQQQVILLGSLIKRLEMHDSIHVYVENGFIIQPKQTKHPILYDIYQQIHYYADQHLITSDGQRDYGNEDILTKLFGYQFSTGSRDAFGPLSAVIKTQIGKLVYG